MSRRSVPQLVEKRTPAPEFPVVSVQPGVQCAESEGSAELRSEKPPPSPDDIGVARIDVHGGGR